ncbi:MAG: hypothetical protein PHV33_07410 [Elusimicrobiales bacterium]|nr:hypothetical protein [Elusimicrobiales bacterium]
MKNIKVISVAVAMLVWGQAVWALGPGMESSRNEGGIKFGEAKISHNMAGGETDPRISGELRPVETARYTQATSSYDKVKLAGKVPVPGAEKTGLASGKEERKGKVTGGVIGGLAAGGGAAAIAANMSLYGTMCVAASGAMPLLVTATLVGGVVVAAVAGAYVGAQVGAYIADKR